MSEMVPFNQTLGPVSWREDTIIPYSGWVVSVHGTIQPNTQARNLTGG